jgi:hypothetical protein
MRKQISFLDVVSIPSRPFDYGMQAGQPAHGEKDV